jgi:[acyl-carrier-protein] S-malonyltransferase
MKGERMKLGFVYAGQGSQKVGMGKDFYETYPLFAETIDRAAEAVKTETDFDLKACSFEGPMEQLSKTRFTQPCMVAFAVGITKLLAGEGITPEYVCGLSLGEYSALYSAGVFDEETVTKLVAYRGRVMEEAVKDREVKMSAVLMTARDIIEKCCSEATERFKEQGLLVQVANYNCPGQIVISGDAQAVDLASELLRECGTKRIVPLPVSGPFHTALMKPAGDALAERFREVDFAPEKATVIFNTTGRSMQEGESIAALLEKQVQSSVYLEDSIRYMAKQGVDTIVEIGPGNTISKFVKKTAPDVTVYSIDSVKDYEDVLAALNK